MPRRSRSARTACVALDWHGGNRSVLVDHELSGLVVGQTLATRPEDVYRALIEATAFGTRTIIETFDAPACPVTEFVVAGGLLKNAFLMQIYATSCGMPRRDVRQRRRARRSASAIHAAVAAGAYPDVPAAAAAMGGRGARAYQPEPAARRRLRPRCTPSTRGCTTTSAAAGTTSCTGCARCAREARS